MWPGAASDIFALTALGISPLMHLLLHKAPTRPFNFAAPQNLSSLGRNRNEAK